MLTVRQVALLVKEYEEALAFYADVLGFQIIEDLNLGGGKRWVRMRAPGGGELLFARAVTDEQRSRVGDQTGGRVFLFFETDNFKREYARLTSRGVRFLEKPRKEHYGTVAIFLDLYGNKIDLIQPRKPFQTRRPRRA
jgi:catechol 2,3-dioxygenase-like lactoylglutathione lyase family enzyme